MWNMLSRIPRHSQQPRLRGLPEDIRALAKPVLAHRIILETKSKYGGVLAEDIVGELLEAVPVPG